MSQDWDLAKQNYYLHMINEKKNPQKYLSYYGQRELSRTPPFVANHGGDWSSSIPCIHCLTKLRINGSDEYSTTRLFLLFLSNSP